MLQFILNKPSKCFPKIAAHTPLESFQKYFRADCNHLWYAGDLICGTKSVLLALVYPIKRFYSPFAKINSLRQKFWIPQLFLNFGNQALYQHWATLELLKTQHEIITSLPSLSKKLQLGLFFFLKKTYFVKFCIIQLLLET